MKSLPILASIGAAVTLAAAVLAPTFAKASVGRQASGSRQADGDWPSYGGTNWSQKYSALDQVDRSNFNALTVAWTWSSPDHELIKPSIPGPSHGRCRLGQGRRASATIRPSPA